MTGILDIAAGPKVQPLRLASGLVMFTFVALHLTNHAAGLAGLGVADEVQTWRIALTHALPFRLLLAAAVTVHLLLGLGKLAARRTLRMPPMELVQLGTGLLIPVLLIPHASAMAYLTSATPYYYSYTSVTFLMTPSQAATQAAALTIVWTHGCVGLYYWLRARPQFQRLQPLLLAVAVALPILALTGALAAGREAHVLLATADAVAAARSDLHWPDANAVATLQSIRHAAWAVYGALLAVAAAIYLARRAARRGGGTVAVTYAGGPQVKAPRGSTLLEISRMHGIPHTSVCGGRARCSTCRVRIDNGAADTPPPATAEAATLARIGAPALVRLACQYRPQGDVGITRLVAPSPRAATRAAHASTDAAGVERQAAVMFLDVRGFTTMTEHRLPFDVVYLLNQFFGSVGEAIRKHGGWIDKYMGDGLMAVFGRTSGVADGCREAIAAAREIDLALDALNRQLASEVPGGIRIGIGIHAGPVVFGHIGDSATAALTVVGRTVNEASRLEALTKDKGCQLIVSKAVANHAGLDVVAAASDTVEIRGTAGGFDIVMIGAARDARVRSDALRPSPAGTGSAGAVR